MARPTHVPMPATTRALRELGENIRLARLRRRITSELLSQRAGISRPTLRKIERGDPRVTLGAYANTLHALGLERDLSAVAKEDELGRKLQDAGLEPKRRAPKTRTKKQDVTHDAPKR